jgi:hypothetical protein
MIREMIAKWLDKVRRPKAQAETQPDHPQVALPLRADLPLRERSRSLVAVPAQINGACMGSGKY